MGARTPASLVRGAARFDPSDIARRPCDEPGRSAEDEPAHGIRVVVGLPELWEHVRLSWTFGYFNPGEAFDTQEDAFLNKISLRIEL